MSKELYPLTNAVIQKVSNLQLVSAMRIISNVQQPPYIPLVEVLTSEQVAKYFGTHVNVISKLHDQNRKLMVNFTDKLCAADIEPYAFEVEDYGRKYSFKKLLFVNGVSVTLSYSKQLVFDARAILMFAIFITQYNNAVGNGNAEKIYEILKDSTFSTNKKMMPFEPWYRYNPDEVDVYQNSLFHRRATPLSDNLRKAVEDVIADNDYLVSVKMLDNKINIEILPKEESQRCEVIN